VKRSDQTIVRQTSNRLRVRLAGAFPRKRVAARHARERPRVSVAPLIAADVFSLTLAWILCMLLFQLAGRPNPFGVVMRSLITIPSTLAIFGLNDLYPASGVKRTEELKRAVMCITGVQVGCLVVFWLLRAGVDLAPVIVLGTLSVVLVSAGRVLIRDVIRNKTWEGSSVMRIPLEARHEDLAEPVIRHPQRGLYRTAAAGGTEEVFAVVPVVSEFEAPEAVPTFVRSVDREAAQKPLTRAFAMWKRLMDILIALTAGVVLAPLIITIIAAVKLTSPGKTFYGHPRIGRNNIPFRVWKFRTMVKDADVVLAERLAADRSLRIEWEQNHKLRADPRLTPIGNFLRRYSLDELPQLWNVIRGEMSIVGPRPIIEAEIAKYAEYFDDYTKVLPGITGLWQVSGRNETTYQQRVQLDSYYVNNWSPLLDIYIMFRTIKAVVSARGAY